MTLYAPVEYSGRSKESIIAMAFEEIGAAGYEFERTPDEMEMGLRRLNVVMATWPFNKMGFNVPDEDEGILKEASGLLPIDEQAVISELAKRLAAVFRIAMGRDWLSYANEAIAGAKARYVSVPNMDYANLTITGAGSKRDVFFPPAFDEEALSIDADPGDLAGMTGA